MYEDYSFVLEWSDLPDGLREEKIDTYITRGFEAHDYDEGRTLAEILEDSDVRRDADRQISARFPMYF